VPSLYRFMALSNHPVARAVRTLRRGVLNFSLPAPRVVVKPMLWTFLALRSTFFFGKRVFVCEPLFKAYCKDYGPRVRTGTFIHWIQGRGDLILGEDIVVDGKCTFSFAARFSDRPTMMIGDHTVISHNCKFSIGKRITIGQHCLIASDVWMFDSSGHASEPSARRAGMPPEPEDVRPITVGDNVWIGTRAIVLPGVTIGECSIVATGSVVTRDVPPYIVVAGNPARKVASLLEPACRDDLLALSPS
jgi:acetyltransferase-like isoleucine patch superfamily enzyme